MANYQVVASVRPRKTPSMYETVVLDNLPVGYIFASSVLKVLDPNPPITGQVGPITWVQLPNMYWVPTVYKSVIYVKEYTPPTNTTHFKLEVAGFVAFEGDLTPLV